MNNIFVEGIVTILLWALNTGIDLCIPFAVATALVEVIAQKRYHLVFRNDPRSEFLYPFMQTSVWIFIGIGAICFLADVISLTGINLGRPVTSFVNYMTEIQHFTLYSYFKYGFVEHPFKTAIFLVVTFVVTGFAISHMVSVTKSYKNLEPIAYMSKEEIKNMTDSLLTSVFGQNR